MSELAPGSDRARPPGTVRISSYLLYLTAAIAVVSMAVSFSTIGAVREVYSDAFADVEMGESVDTFVVGGIIVIGVLTLLVAIGLVVLSFLNLRGKNVARIITWVLGGVYLLCCGGLSLAGASGFGGASSTDGGPDPAEIERQLDAALPDWYGPVNVVLQVIPILAVLVALILLALPASNEWFKPKAATWEPPTPGYPVMPGSSYPTPQFPQQAGEPPLPPAPPVPGSEPPETPAPPVPGSEPPETPAPPR
ncbi:hypothetical protein SAMN05421812_11989 [Asanoa hainanensis]|uniref:Uncharacterized protein n=1 Tax=Asanoa hainanensis TaxID=560556 RepID=A0A239PEF5_9ACTN|nr:hypothetical protein [Asanoa hainanensis]SNT65014.1 hypothetical protein SAMN05421812_11989 [Asanoa hainanensis]